MKIEIKNTNGKQITVIDAPSLRGAIESIVSQSSAYSDLTGADLQGADLYRANIPEARLMQANLSGANLHGANLDAAVLSYSDLSGADLSRANLSGCNLLNANLRGANLQQAILAGADLTGAVVEGADFTGADTRTAIGINYEQLGYQAETVKAEEPGSINKDTDTSDGWNFKASAYSPMTKQADLKGDIASALVLALTSMFIGWGYQESMARNDAAEAAEVITATNPELAKAIVANPDEHKDEVANILTEYYAANPGVSK